MPRELSHVCRVLQLILIMLATNANLSVHFDVSSEHHDTTKAKQPNIITYNQDKTDQLDLTAVANDYINESEHRLKLYSNELLLQKVSLSLH